MRNIFYIILLVAILSCKSIKIDNSFVGEYLIEIKDYNCKLLLNKNKTFVLDIINIGGKSGCIGEWHKEKNLIVLNCKKIDKVEEVLQRGYLQKREIEIKIKSKTELLYNNVLLKKIGNK
jgi:hypothetical protein